MFEYDLPPDRIAQRPVSGERSNARLLVAGANRTEDRNVFELPQILSAGDLLLLNDTRVRACRFFPPALEGGEIFLIGEIGAGSYRILARPLRKLSEGASIELSADIQAKILRIDRERGEAVAELSVRNDSRALPEVIEEQGLMPIPPYIRNGKSDAEDRASYQTVVANRAGSIAAPTAALHFTPALLEELRGRGVEIRLLTLNVGLSSILSVERQTESGAVGEEEFVIPRETFEALRSAKSAGRRIIGVGTTVTRAVESLSEAEWEGSYDFAFRKTGLFIQPGFRFRVLDLLMTNFHQSGSTHLSLVGAFAGEVRVRAAYEHALKNGYRFLSYGDSMLLERDHGITAHPPSR